MAVDFIDPKDSATWGKKESYPYPKYLQGVYRITVSCWQGGYRKRFIPITETLGKRQALREADKLETQLTEELEKERDLKRSGTNELVEEQQLTLKDLAEKRMRVYGLYGQDIYYWKHIIKEIGDVRSLNTGIANIDVKPWREGYFKMMEILKTYKTKYGNLIKGSSIKRYQKVLRCIFDFGIEEGSINKFPLKIKYEKDGERERIWTLDERKAIFQAAEELGSFLYWPIYFSEWNPIRASDLFALTKVNLDRENNWIVFTLGKIKKRNKKKKLCFLKQLDIKIHQYFNSLPADCPFLFPKFLKDGSWAKVKTHNKNEPYFEKSSEYGVEWARVLIKAYTILHGQNPENKRIEDLHFHDLKHVAVTNLAEKGNYTEWTFRNCGIQYSKSLFIYKKNDIKFVQDVPGFEKPKSQFSVLTGTDKEI